MKNLNADGQKKFGRKIRIYIILAVIMLAIYYLLDLEVFSEWSNYIPFLKRLTISLIAISIVLLTEQIIERIITGQRLVEGDRYNLLRIIRLLTMTFSIIIIASFLF